jgi:hypothetical protein
MTSVSSDARQRASDKLARLTGQGLDLVSFWRASTEVLAGARCCVALTQGGLKP